MSENRYCVELSKTGRSKCKKCGKPIDKDALRIVTIIPARGEDSYELRQNVHAACFSLPRQYTVGATKMTPEDFVADVLEDISEDGVVLPERAAELAAAIGGPKPKKDDKDSPIYAVKQAFLARRSEEEDEEKEPAAKKTKTTKDDATAVVPTEHGGVDSRMVDAYAQYHKHTLPALKEILKWNRQHVTGTKDVLLHRILDGVVRGRLPRCPLDGGRLKLDENDPKKPARHNMVTCNGTFDEDSHTRLDCGYCQKVEDAPRVEWYTEEPTEEQKEEMDRQDAEAKGEGPAPGSDAAAESLKKAVKDLDWELTTRPGLKAAAQGLVSILQNQPDDETKLDIPEDTKVLQQKVGALITANKDLTAEELVPHIIEQFGLKQAKEAKAAKKAEAVENAVKCEANGAIISALTELLELYAKEKNRNAANTYRKVVAALSDLDFEITAENALGLGKGKNKVHNIGPSSAEKIHEFVTTGTMVKLEEKRADAA